MAVRFTTLDGTPVDPTVMRARWAELAELFQRTGADLGATEREVLARLGPRLRRAVRAYTRVQIFERALKEWRTASKLRRAAIRRGATLPEIVAFNRFRPPYYAPDERGRYAWARQELQAELAKAWPKQRRKDQLLTELLRIVKLALLRQLYPKYKERDIERGIATRVDRLAAQFLALHFPFLARGASANRLRRRPSLRPRRA